LCVYLTFLCSITSCVCVFLSSYKSLLSVYLYFLFVCVYVSLLIIKTFLLITIIMYLSALSLYLRVYPIVCLSQYSPTRLYFLLYSINSFVFVSVGSILSFILENLSLSMRQTMCLILSLELPLFYIQ